MTGRLQVCIPLSGSESPLSPRPRSPPDLHRRLGSMQWTHFTVCFTNISFSLNMSVLVFKFLLWCLTGVCVTEKAVQRGGTEAQTFPSEYTQTHMGFSAHFYMYKYTSTGHFIRNTVVIRTIRPCVLCDISGSIVLETFL